MSLKDELIESLEANYIETIRNGFYEGRSVRALIPPLHENETKKVREARNTIPKILDSYLNQRDNNGRTGLRLTPFMVTDTLLIETDDRTKGTLYSLGINSTVTEDYVTQSSVDAEQSETNIGIRTRHNYVQSPGIRRMALLKRTGYKVTEDGDDFIIECEYELRTLDNRALRNKYHKDNDISMEDLEARIIRAIGCPNADDNLSYGSENNHPMNFGTAVKRKWNLKDRMASAVNELFPREGEHKFVTCAVMNFHCAQIFVSLNKNMEGMWGFELNAWDGEVTSLTDNGIVPPVTPFEMNIREGARRNMLTSLLAIDYLSPVPYMYEILKPSLMTQVLWYAEYFSDEHNSEEVGKPKQATLHQRDSGFGEGGENYSDEYFIKLEGFNEIDILNRRSNIVNRARLTRDQLFRRLSKMKFTQILVNADSNRRLSIDSKAIKLHKGTQRAELPLIADVVEMDGFWDSDETIEDVTIGNIYLVKVRNITDGDFESLKSGKTVFERLVPYGNQMSIVVAQNRGMRIGANASIHTLERGVWILYPDEKVESREIPKEHKYMTRVREFSLSDYYHALDETKNWSILEYKSRLGYSGTHTRTTDDSSMTRRVRTLNNQNPTRPRSPTGSYTSVPALSRRRRRLTLESKNEEE